MTDSNFDQDAQINKEMQRSEMQEILRSCNSAVILAVHPTQGLIYAYMNLSPIEQRGMAELMRDTSPKFSPTDDDED